MADDSVTGHRNEREFVEVVPVIAEGIHEPCLAILRECLVIDLKNCVDIFGTFRRIKNESILFLGRLR